MFRVFPFVIAITLFLSSVGQTFAQAETPFAEPPISGIEASQPTGPLQCFDYYTFGSVQADLQTNISETVPGAQLTFSGAIVNANNYPLVDGTLYAKIFRRDEATFAEGDGNEVVDQFVVTSDVTLPANGSVPASYQWQVPVNAEGGEYYAAYFFITSERYNLMGLSFTDDVVGNTASFRVASENAVAKLSKVDTTLNDRNHHFAAFPLTFSPTETVTVRTTITNPTDKEKLVPLQWNQFAWDAANPDNRRNTKTELVTLAPNETKEVTYTVKEQRESIVYITAKTDDQGAKSILNIRYVRDGIEETRINFPGVTAFPLKQGVEQTLFACAHSTNAPIVPGNTLTLTLKDKKGSTIHEYRYEGDIAGAMSGFGNTFTPDKNYNYLLLTATLEREGVVIEEVKIVYDCQAIDSNSCLPEAPQSFLDKLLGVSPLVYGGVLLLLVLLTIAWMMYRRHKDFTNNHLDAVSNTPKAFLFFLLLLPALFFGTGEVEAKSVSWNGGVPELYYSPVFASPYDMDNKYWGWSGHPISATPVAVSYLANIRDATTNTPIQDGATVPIGTRIAFDVPMNNNQISLANGATNSFGHWRTGATMPSGTSLTDRTSGFSAGSCGGAYLGINISMSEGDGNVYTPLAVNPPASSIAPSGTASLNQINSTTWEVTGAGTIQFSVTFPSTYGRFYTYLTNPCGWMLGDYPWNYFGDIADGLGFNALGISRTHSTGLPLVAESSLRWDSCAYRTQNIANTCIGDYSKALNPITSVPAYQVNIPAQTITFNLTASGPANIAPNAPTIVGPTTGTTNTNYSFAVQASDGDGDTVRYGISNAACTAVSEWLPGSGYVNSGTTQTKTGMSWGTAGTYTLYALTEDSKGARSSCTSHTITIAAPLITTPVSCTPGTPTTKGVVLNSTPINNTVWVNIYGQQNACASFCEQQTINHRGETTCEYYESGTAAGGWAAGISACNVYSGSPETGAATSPYGCGGDGCGGVLNEGFSRCDYISAPLTPTADLKINGFDSPITVNKNTPLNITWNSTNAASCTLYGAGLPGGSVALSGSVTVSAGVLSSNSPESYILTCGGAVDQVVVTVTNQPPNAPGITGPTGAEGGVTSNFTITATDPDNDNVYYEIDWDNDGTVEVSSPVSSYVTSGTGITAQRAWPTAGSYTFQARAVDSDNARSGWTQHTITINSSVPPTATLEASVNGGPFTAGDRTIDPGDAVSLSWRSTGATTCTGTNFNTGGAVSGSTGVTIPAPNSAIDFGVSCSGINAPGLRITTRALPNLNQPNVTFNLSPGYDPLTGVYDSVSVIFQTTNDGGSATQVSADYRVRFDRGSDGYDETRTGNLGLFNTGQTVSRTEVFNNVSFSGNRVEVIVDIPDRVVESNESDNERVLDINPAPPDPNLEIRVNRSPVRRGETVTLDWDTNATYPMNCSVFGPGVGPIDFNPSVDGPTGTELSQLINAKSEFTLRCTEPISNTTFTESVAVEIIGEIEEI